MIFTPKKGIQLALMTFLLFSLLFSGGRDWAQASLSMLSDPSRGKTEPEGAEKYWLAFREYMKRGDWEKSAEELEKIYQWKLDRGIRNHYLYSLALIRESQRMMEEEKSTAAVGLLNYAEKMAPDFSQVAQARVRWFGSQILFSWRNAIRVCWNWGQAVFLSLSNVEEALPQMTNLTLWILSGFLITIAAFSFFVLLRYYAHFVHHLNHLIRMKENFLPGLVLALGLAFVPFFLGLGWLWLFVFWFLLFAVYGRRNDRFVIIICLLLLGLLPVGLRFYTSLLTSIPGNGIPEILKANTGVCDGEGYQRLLAMHQKDPQDPDLLQVIGLVEKRRGNFKEAEQRFLQWSQIDPQSSAAYNNLGNIYLFTNRLDQAVEAYGRAIQLEPSRSEAYYNLGQAHLLKLRMKEAETQFERARSLNPGMITYYTSIASRHPNRLAIDRTLETARIWKRILQVKSSEGDEIAGGLWKILWRPIPFAQGWITLPISVVFMGLITWISRSIPLIRNCERCGRLICSRCTRSVVIGNQCVQCLNAFATHQAADAQMMRKKRAEMARYKVWLQSLPRRLSLIFPGAGHLVIGRPKEGIVCLFIFILFLSGVFLGLRGVPSPLTLHSSVSISWIFIMAVLFLFFYWFVQVRMNRLVVGGGKHHFRRA